MQPYVTSWRLRDVPELGYYLTDKPYPRGELLVRTTATVPGYYKHEKVTSCGVQAFTHMC